MFADGEETLAIQISIPLLGLIEIILIWVQRWKYDQNMSHGNSENERIIHMANRYNCVKVEIISCH